MFSFRKSSKTFCSCWVSSLPSVCTDINNPGAVQHHCQFTSVKTIHNNYPTYLSEDAVNSLLVHVARDGFFTQARSDRAEVVQRRHPERHFCLLVTELVHLEHKEWTVRTTTNSCFLTDRGWVMGLTSSRPSKLSSSSAAGHSGLLTVESRSWTKFSNRGL